MSKKKQEYDNESIELLEGADRVRKRPAVIFGSDGPDGCRHSVFEILSNSIDEARSGNGNKIILTKFKDDSYQVEDFGRGCPVDFNQAQQRYNWELVYCELYAGGKYHNNDSSSYEFSLGLNGLGACATQYASEYMDVTVYRDGFQYDLHFEKGENVGGLKKKEFKGKRTGTVQRWKPDLEVFTEIKIDTEYFVDMLKKQAVVNPNVEFVLREEKADGTFEEQSFLYENGISDYVTELVGDKGLTSVQYYTGERIGRDRADMEDYRVKLGVAFAFSNYVQITEYFHNSSFLEHGGSPDDAVKLAFTYMINKWIKDNNKYTKNEKPISFTDIADCLVLVSSSFSTVTSYANQTKKAISNKFIKDCMNEFLREQLEVYFIEKPDEAAKLCEQVLINKRSREKAESSRLNIKNALTQKMDLANQVAKFNDCRSKDVSIRELYIVEGDSALGSVKMARDSEFQAVIPIRGKILNCLKADYARIFKSEIITDLIKVLGCGVEVQTKSNKEISNFNLAGLRWNKIIICTDADYDGFQIRTLVLTMIYRLCPTLIDKGYVYIAESPLFEITVKEKGGKEKTYFAYDESEKADILKKIGDKKYTLQRSKGLGENEPEMMSLTTMNPSTRRLIKVNPTDADRTAQMFDMLLGDDLQARKDHISEFGHDYLEMADIS
ncbi:DNA gyrase subunit B [Ruminococcus sp. YE71]|uniref:toprim domain-containing protein n=1 Tax=unclassified Ruminococcus TaxID=2608920 RepID=UPI00088CBA25|nr:MULTISPECIES: toprim domain-containing protein [unclassified Ruminococcus]SDA17239.1 DNA gyrase subunit B [Ruminococcus sp. YE78]SFW26539.1 DNA gyrase subunit B [Ruminococcus sp. YE71]